MELRKKAGLSSFDIGENLEFYINPKRIALVTVCVVLIEFSFLRAISMYDLTVPFLIFIIVAISS